MANCTECEQIYSEKLSSLPSKWRNSLVSIICNIPETATNITCTSIKECETVTRFSEFRLSGSSVCIDYTDEIGNITTKCFDLNVFFNTIDPKCITTKDEWLTWTFVQRFQAILNKITLLGCYTTTTTTTVEPCPTINNMEWGLTTCPSVSDITWSII